MWWQEEVMHGNDVNWMSQFGTIRCQVIELKYWCCVKQKTWVSWLVLEGLSLSCVCILVVSGSCSQDASCIMLSMFTRYFKAVPCLMKVGFVSFPYPYMRSHNYLLIYAQDYIYIHSFMWPHRDVMYQYTCSWICIVVFMEISYWKLLCLLHV